MSPNSLRVTESLVASLPLCCDVAPDVVRDIVAAARLSRHEKGEILLQIGEQALRFCILTEGWACLRKGNAEGQESILHILGRHDTFPDILGKSDRAMSLVSAEALTSVAVLSFPLTTLRELCARSAALSANLLVAAGRRAQDLLDHVEQLTLHDAEQRVGRFLLRLHLSQSALDVKIIDLPFEKSTIASYLGIKPETLSRVLQHFRQQGFVNERTHVTIPDIHALCTYCDARAAQDCLHADTAHCPYPLSDVVEPV